MANLEMENKVDTLPGRKIYLFLLVPFFVAGYVFLSVLLSSTCNSSSFFEENVQPIRNPFHIAYGNVETDQTLPAPIRGKAQEKIILTRVLEHREMSGDTIALYTNRAFVSVYLNEQVLALPYSDEGVNIPIPRASAWTFARIPDYYAGRTLRIEIEYQYDKYADELPAILMGSKANIIMYILRENLLALIICLSIVIVGVFLLVLGICFQNRMFARQFASIGFLAVIVAIWNILDTELIQLITGNVTIATTMMYLAFYLIPAAAFSFLLSYPGFAKLTNVRVLYLISIASFFIINLIQVTGLATYSEMVIVVQVETLFMLAVIVYDYLGLRKTEGFHEEVYVFVAIAAFAAMCVLDIVLYYFKTHTDSGKFTRIGVLVFFVLAGYSIVAKANDLRVQEAERNLYKRLAYFDVMSGVPNRTAFDSDLKEIVERGDDGVDRVAMMADVNNLKMINDIFGHQSGDDAIQTVASILKKNFSTNCKCYRLGGDEFAVIGEHVVPEEFEKKRQRFLCDIELANREKEYPLVVATGYHSLWTDMVEEGFSKADQAMYENKRQLKASETMADFSKPCMDHE